MHTRSMEVLKLTFKRDYAYDDASGEKYEADQEPQSTPSLTRETGGSTELGEPWSVRFVRFAEYQVIQNIPQTVEARHDSIDTQVNISTRKEIMANNTAFTYPMKRTKYFRPTPCANHQRKTMIAMNAIPIPRVNQFLAHHKVRSRHVPRNMDAILDAKMLNPHMTSTAPIAEEPRYPAGSVQYGFPPCWLIIYLMCKLPTMVFFSFLNVQVHMWHQPFAWHRPRPGLSRWIQCARMSSSRRQRARIRAVQQLTANNSSRMYISFKTMLCIGQKRGRKWYTVDDLPWKEQEQSWRWACSTTTG